MTAAGAVELRRQQVDRSAAAPLAASGGGQVDVALQPIWSLALTTAGRRRGL